MCLEIAMSCSLRVIAVNSIKDRTIIMTSSPFSTLSRKYQVEPSSVLRSVTLSQGRDLFKTSIIHTRT